MMLCMSRCKTPLSTEPVLVSPRLYIQWMNDVGSITAHPQKYKPEVAMNLLSAIILARACKVIMSFDDMYECHC